MQSFLEKTVEHLVSRYGEKISELCIVLPNRRAGLFMKKDFAKQLGKTFWSPAIYATEDFVALLSGMQSADPATLLFELYATVKKCDPANTETFDEFSKWGQILLSDINEIDRYLTDTKQLFGNLKNIRELETWSLNAGELTEFQSQYLKFWQSLAIYYDDFTTRLLEKKEAYQGLAYRIVAKDPEVRAANHPWKKIIFAGFNALNKAEEVIIERLVDAGKAEIIWDMDSYYAEDPAQEAGRFYRKYDISGRFKKIKERNTVFMEELLSNQEKSVTIIGTPKNVAQAKVAGSIVAELAAKQGSLQDTALVLADENLLFPVLHSLPESLEDINVTMGYPLRNTPVAGYFELLFSMHDTGIRLAKDKPTYSYYHTDILKLLSHPYTALAVSSGGSTHSVRNVVYKFRARNIVFAASSTIRKIFNESNEEDFKKIGFLFDNWKTPADALACMQGFIMMIKDAIVRDQEKGIKTSLELEYLFAFTKIIKRIQVLMDDFPGAITSVKSLKSIISQIVRTSTLPFYGEPLMGLQVMGMLETRTLDFENIILLSCNEDILPSGKSVNSFIPFELKRHFGLPTYSDKDAIFAYHFYRLLQRAKNIYLIYNTESDALGSGEKSRYLTQLIHELPAKNPSAHIKDMLLNTPLKIAKDQKLFSVVKDETVMQKLAGIAEYGFSPSQLNKFRNCSLQFYYHAVAGLKENEEVEETIGADLLGNVIHKVLETLYTPFIGKIIRSADIKGMRQQVEALAMKEFSQHYDSSELSAGKNLLTIKVALKFIFNFLDAELRMTGRSEEEGAPVIIKALEQELEAIVSVGDSEIRVKGKADRIDAAGKKTRIIDYKTGTAVDSELKVGEWEEITTETELAKSFQLLMYAYMYQKMNPSIKENIESGIITFRQLSAGIKPVNVLNKKVLDEQLLSEFEVQLQKILFSIMDPSDVFIQTEVLDNCIYCSFRGICNR